MGLTQVLSRVCRAAHELVGHGYIPMATDGFWATRCTPTKSLRKAAKLFNTQGGKTIVEIGTGIHGVMSGNSMRVWTRRTRARQIIAVDLDEKRLEEVRVATAGYQNVTLVLDDGIKYLRSFGEKIDLLYLDFWVPDPEGALPGTGRANAYLEAFEAAEDKLGKPSLILMDDTDHVDPWKQTLIVPRARESGYVVAYAGRQTLLVR